MRLAWILVGLVLILVLPGCRTRQRVPDYLPREVVANQVGQAVVYDLNDPRRIPGSIVQPVASPAEIRPAPVTPSVSQPVTGEVVAPVGKGGAVTPANPLRRTLYGQPEGILVTDKGLREATVSWKEPTDEVYRYRIERSESPDGPFVKLAEVSPRKKQYRDKGTDEAPLKDSTSYYYQIVAMLDREGPESIASKVVKAVTAPPPSVPGRVMATAPSSRAVKVAWAPSPSEGVTLYRVERASAMSGPFDKVGVSRSPILTDGGTAASTLKDSTRYYYRVITVNRVNAESQPSDPVEVLTLPPPAPVQKVIATGDEVRCVPLSWVPSPEPDVVRYDVYRARSANGSFQKIGSVPGRMVVTYLDGGTNPGTLEDEACYYYRIRAINAVTAEGGDSATVSATTRGIPAEVGSVTATPGRPREVPVSWMINSDKAVVGYEVWRAEEGSDEWLQVGRVIGRENTGYLDRGEIKPKPGLGLLKDGTIYLYKVIAFNQGDVRSSASSAASARTKYRPATPAGIVTTTNSPLCIKLTWKANPEKDISDYVVEAANAADGSFRKLVTVVASKADGLSATEMALESGVTRFYRVKAMDKDGLESDWSLPVAGSAKPAPGMPVSVMAQPVGTNIRLAWQAPVQPDIRRYKVWRKKFLGWELISTTEQTNYLFEFTELSKPMTVAVSAMDQDELESEKSDSLEIKPGM